MLAGHGHVNQQTRLYMRRDIDRPGWKRRTYEYPTAVVPIHQDPVRSKRNPILNVIPEQCLLQTYKPKSNHSFQLQTDAAGLSQIPPPYSSSYHSNPLNREIHALTMNSALVWCQCLRTYSIKYNETRGDRFYTAEIHKCSIKQRAWRKIVGREATSREYRVICAPSPTGRWSDTSSRLSRVDREIR